MIIRQQLLKTHSRENADFIEDYVARTPGAAIELMACFLSDETKVAQRSSQVVGNLGRHHPEMLEPWWDEMITAGDQPTHIAIRRNVTRYFSELELPIPNCLEKRIAESFTDWAVDVNSPVAVAVFAMQFVADRHQKFPKLAESIKNEIESRMESDSATPGFCNRGRKILQQLAS
ncbi:hypothetical protein [Mariniblastus fucicola]|uniref:DNA alkylation repair enzyme n=1 Tax=Mariniblastus fucicola TaxID=980251 RepID=A0A5B9P8B7_9BACT|nr:hypothetical protein [Mariniblastus fucicola]QEG22947.1 hypothetical protein MFFC18_28350 [Mariniblastus fucicola]